MNGDKSRSRMSITVDAELSSLLDLAKWKSGQATASKAIRWALKTATTPTPEPPTATLGLKVIKWAKELPFLSPQERLKMRELVREMYRQVKG